MFEEIFKYPAVVARHREAPFSQERERYLAHRAKDGVARATLVGLARELLIVVREMGVEAEGMVALRTIESAAERWARRQKRRHRAKVLGWSRGLFVQVARDWLAFLGRLAETGPESASYAPLLEDFVRSMRSERGLAPTTIKNYVWFAQCFLRWFSEQGRLFAEVSVLDVDAFIGQCAGNWGRVSMAGCAKSLRAFFRHVQRCGWCAAGIAEAIESPRVFKQEALPAGPDWYDVQRLIASSDTDRPKDVRDRPILMLLSIYGLRSAEVAHLRLDDLDWERERIRVFRSKQRRTQEYPLTRNVGEGILRYLKQVRPRSNRREVFLRLRAPLVPLSPGGMHNLVSTRMARLNIASPGRGPHALRHACAAHLVAQGFSLKEIGDHLGHRSAYATRIYAKVDLEGLREVARFELGSAL